jgi:hypothetical protein
MKINTIAVFLFLTALLPRLPGLACFLTSDENTNIVFAGSKVIDAFLQGDLQNTYWHFYPGVTMTWLDTLGIAGQYLLEGVTGKQLPPFSVYIYGDILSLLVAVRLPYAILTAAVVPAIYLLARKLLSNSVALLGALFVAFDPFYLAHSRVAHGDAPVTVFMSLSTLTFFVYLQRVSGFDDNRGITTWKITATDIWQPFTDPYLVTSAIFGGLAALTKVPGQFIALFVIGLALLSAFREIWRLKKQQPLPLTFYVLRFMCPWLIAITAWGLISLLIFVLLWPAMWANPIGTLSRMAAETFGKVDEGHLVYFFGQPTLDPGPWFYLYVIPFRLTPIVVIGCMLSLGLFVLKILQSLKVNRFKGSQVEEPSNLPTSQPSTPYSLLPTSYSHFLLWLFVISLLLFGNLSPKKQDRYLLPLFPFLDLLAALGWLGLASIINYQLSIINEKISRFSPYSPLRVPTSYFLLILLFFQALPLFTYYPYYLTYFNPLMGGPRRAAETTLLGWGEGMEQVAAYLNTKPHADELYVASTPSQTLLPYFAGTGENFYTNDIAFRADYVVLYVAQMQRLAPSPDIVRYFESQQPEKIITIHDVTYAKIYPGPKYILADIPPQATPLNIGLDNILRLAGYEILTSQSETQPFKLTLYWHALAPLETNYTVSLRARTKDNRLLVQQDHWPLNGLLPTSQWRQGDYITDIHTLDLDPAQISQINHFEIVLYNTQTGQTLGPPITINNHQ